MRNTVHKNGTYFIYQLQYDIAIDTCVRTIGPLHASKFFDFKLCLMRYTDHKNGTPNEGRRSRFVITIYFTSEVQLNTAVIQKSQPCFLNFLLWHHSASVYHH